MKLCCSIERLQTVLTEFLFELAVKQLVHVLFINLMIDIEKLINFAKQLNTVCIYRLEELTGNGSFL